jgi:two-component system OmpR family sensor kinase
MLHSVRGRLTLYYTAVLAVVLITFSSISFALLAREIRTATDNSLQDTAREFAAAVAQDPTNAVAGAEVQLDFRYSDREILVVTTSGAVVASSRRHLAPAEQQRIAEGVRHGMRGLVTIPGGPENDGIRLFLLPVSVMGQRYLVVVARQLDEQADRLESAARAVFFGIPLALLVAAGGGYLLARNALRPVTDMSRNARQISAATLTARVPVKNEGDELGFLALTLNDLLGRLQTSFDSQRRFMADASHELRTPVAIIQGEADVTLAREDRTPAEYRESLMVMRKAAQKLTRIVENLFLLARTDAGSYPIRRSRFYLEELIGECVRSMKNIAAARDVRLEQSTPSDLLIEADEELIHRLILNLIDNALKFTPGGGRVLLEATREDGGYRLRVADSGVGIAPADQARVFERFYRVDRARGAQVPSTEAASGAGLGLPIGRWIAEAHGGSLSLEKSDPTGTIFSVRLPAEMP